MGGGCLTIVKVETAKDISTRTISGVA